MNHLDRVLNYEGNTIMHDIASKRSNSATTILSHLEPAGRPIPTDPDILLYPAEAAYLMGISTGTLANWRVQGKGPSFISFGKNIRYRRSDVVDWIADQRFTSTSEAGAK